MNTFASLANPFGVTRTCSTVFSLPSDRETTVTFDTLKFSRRLKEAGVPEKQAEAEAEALAKAFQTNTQTLVTKSDLNELRAVTKADLNKLRIEINSDLRLVKWMLALVILVNVVPTLKTLFLSS